MKTRNHQENKLKSPTYCFVSDKYCFDIDFHHYIEIHTFAGRYNDTHTIILIHIVIMRRLISFMIMLIATLTISAQTGSWTNDKAHTRIGFEVTHAGLSFVSGRFADFDITVDAQGKHYLNSKVTAVIRTKSIATGVEARDNHLRSADFFDVEKYPTMTFKATKAVMQTKTRGKLYGTLTIKDITRPIVLDAQLIAHKISPMSKVMTAGFRLKGTVKRSDFKLGPKFLPAIIGDNVNIIIDAEFSPNK